MSEHQKENIVANEATMNPTAVIEEPAQNEAVQQAAPHKVPMSHWLSYTACAITVIGLIVSCAM